MTQENIKGAPTPSIPKNWTELTGATNKDGIINSPGPKEWGELTGMPAIVIDPCDYEEAVTAYLPPEYRGTGRLTPPWVTDAADLALAAQGIFPKDKWPE